jgi:bifunctional non-homologous end joining protein LigD
LRRTPEPPPGPGASPATALTFVVQKHAARRLHYDFRLEAADVLKSWAVPHGPSADPAEKRLAVQVEDHPLDYARFEGVIPRGEYGAGEVIVWDEGTYLPLDEDRPVTDRPAAEAAVARGLAAGKLTVLLRGRKLRGAWTLVHMRAAAKNWLLIKRPEAEADAARDALAADRSVRSGLTIADLEAGRRPTAAARPAPGREARTLPGARRAAMPTAPRPMLPTLTDRPFSHPDWLFEPKLDGYRTVALLRPGAAVRLLSRNGVDISDHYPTLVADFERLGARAVVLDGEVVALDEAGRPSFQRLQGARREGAHPRTRLVYYVFDLLYADGYDLRAAPLEARKALLESLLSPTERVRLLEHFAGDGREAYEAAVAHGLEGLIAKQRQSRYETGRRSRHWLKVKATCSDEFVVGGFTRGTGARAGAFGALLLGQYDAEGRLLPVGHVGTGFDARALAALRRQLDVLRTDSCPFARRPALNAAATWVEPKLVAEVKFAERTRDGQLRTPVFVGLREDKRPADVRPAAVVPAPPDAAPGDPPPPPAAGGPVAAVLEQLAGAERNLALTVEGHALRLTNLDRVLWPAAKGRPHLTKRDLLIYLARVSPYLLPHLRDRPLTLIRYPRGIAGERFFQQHAAPGWPEFVRTVCLYSEQNRADREYVVCNDLATLLWLGQIAGLEIHAWLSRTSGAPDAEHLPTRCHGSAAQIDRCVLNYPDFLVFDLDPYLYSGREARGAEPELHREAFAAVCEVTLALKDILDGLA